jgi:uncharacterized protein YbjT (DUF2867 family)
MTPPLIAVCGATGQQGGAVIRSLLSRGVSIRALTRQPNGERARALAASGVEVRMADFGDATSLQAAFAGATGVFGVTQPWSADYRHVYVDMEIAHGKAIAAACKSAGVGHLVFSSVMKVTEEASGIPHVDSKFIIEQAIFDSGVPYTLLRPGTFMDNIGLPFFPVKKHTVKGFTDGDAKLPFVCCRDIGEAAANAFLAPERWRQRAVNLVSDFASGDDLAATLARLRSAKMKYKSTPALLMRLFVPEFYKMRRAFEEMGRPPFRYQAEIDRAMTETRELNPGLWSLEAYLRQATFA